MSEDEAREGACALVAAYKLAGLTMEEIIGVLSFAFCEVLVDPDTRPETTFAIAEWLDGK